MKNPWSEIADFCGLCAFFIALVIGAIVIQPAKAWPQNFQNVIQNGTMTAKPLAPLSEVQIFGTSPGMLLYIDNSRHVAGITIAQIGFAAGPAGAIQFASLSGNQQLAGDTYLTRDAYGNVTLGSASLHSPSSLSWIGSYFNGTVSQNSTFTAIHEFNNNATPTSILHFYNLSNLSFNAVRVPNIIADGITPGTSPICANGTANSLTTVGCSSGSSAHTMLATQITAPSGSVPTISATLTGVSTGSIATYSPANAIAAGDVTAAVSNGCNVPQVNVSTNTVQLSAAGGSCTSNFTVGGVWNVLVYQ